MSLKIRKILGPIQFNDPYSIGALQVIRELAAETHAEIVLMHSMPRSIVKPDLPGYRDLFAEDENAVVDELKKLADQHLHGHHCAIVVKKGDPANMIKAAAQEVGSDLIVMATHGRRGITHIVMGSTAEKVVREAPCMVLTIRPEILGEAVPE